jgi:SAM-dependent methyltransferase
MVEGMTGTSTPDLGAYWGGVYRDRGAERVSWYQPEPAESLRLLELAGLTPASSVIDVGGGASPLVDRLLERGVTDVTVLDVADDALRTSRERLGPAAGTVTWLVEDLLRWHPARRYDRWHDRAVFHFLTDHEDRARYVHLLDEALAPDGRVVIATFAADGPQACSGLPVARYDDAGLAAQFPMLRPVYVGRQEHTTPAGVIQPFTWLVLSR